MGTTVEPALAWGNASCQFHVEQQADGSLAIMLGLHRLEVVPADPKSVQYRMAMGRLVNGRWAIRALAEAFGHDTRTLRRWAEALLESDSEAMARKLSGRGAETKVTEAMLRLVYELWTEAKDRTRQFRDWILEKVERVFGVAVSWEALRPGLLAMSASVGSEEAREGFEEAAAEAVAGAGQAGVEASPQVPAGTRPPEGAAAGGAAAGAGVTALSVDAGAVPAMGCAMDRAAEAERWPATQGNAGGEAEAAGLPRDEEAIVQGGTVRAMPAVDPAAAAGDAAAGQGDAGGEGQAAEPPGGPRRCAAAAEAVVAAPRELIPGGASVPVGRKVLVHHAGQVLAARCLDSAGQTIGQEAGGLLRDAAMVLQGAENFEQVRDLSREDLSWFTAVPVGVAPTQREHLQARCARSAEAWLAVLRGNAQLLPDGPGHGTVFYYDPHTKQYTGRVPFLKGWCGRRHQVTKVLHLDFFHTRSGHPCFEFPADNYADMRERFFLELEWFDRLFPCATPEGRIFVIDRAIFGIDTFALLRARHDHLVTWEKGYVGTGWREQAPTQEFLLQRPRNRQDDLREWTFKVQDHPWERDPSWRCLVVRATNPEKRTIEVGVLCSHPTLSAQEAVTLIFSRWLQENDFRTLDRHFGIMQLTSRRHQPYATVADLPPDRMVESPEHREVCATARHLRDTLQKLFYQRERLTDALANLERNIAMANARLAPSSACVPPAHPPVPPSGAGASASPTVASTRELRRYRRTAQQAPANRKRLQERLAKLIPEIEQHKRQYAELEQRLRTVSDETSRLQLLIAAGYHRPDTTAKHLFDCVKILARNVCYALLLDLRRHYDNRRDDLAILRLVTRAAGTLECAEGYLRVGLWLRASLEPAVRRRIDGFLTDVSEQINRHFQGRAIPVAIRLLPGAPEL